MCVPLHTIPYGIVCSHSCDLFSLASHCQRHLKLHITLIYFTHPSNYIMSIQVYFPKYNDNWSTVIRSTEFFSQWQRKREEDKVALMKKYVYNRYMTSLCDNNAGATSSKRKPKLEASYQSGYMNHSSALDNSMYSELHSLISYNYRIVKF